ncbi:MAG: hypothetical protein GY799_23535 [Desulfobulbaceae bacterium]|nr:hypothetical protein [Desulfobulbaceae bacterium]
MRRKTLYRKLEKYAGH